MKLSRITPLLLCLFLVLSCKGYADESAPSAETDFVSEAETDEETDTDEEEEEEEPEISDELLQALKESAENGTAEEQERVANMLFARASQDNERTELPEAVRWYTKAAEQGSRRACRIVAAAYWMGEGVEQSPETAAVWYRRAGELGDVDAWISLAQMYFQGKGIPTDWAESYRCLKQAEKVALESDEAADIGVVESTLAVYHDNGIGTDEDKVAARECLERALATKPSAKAVFLMGLYHADGLGGLQQDDAKAMMYYRDAAIMGDKEAQCNLASGYAMGRGVTKDMQCALVWFRASAAQGCAMALLNLGRCYALGDGVERNLTTARGYFAEAAACGSKQAEQYMKTIDAAEYGDAEEPAE